MYVYVFVKRLTQEGEGQENRIRLAAEPITSTATVSRKCNWDIDRSRTDQNIEQIYICTTVMS